MKWFEMVENEIFPQKEDRDKSLFRIIPFDSLLQMLNERKNTLVNTSKWEDVYENFMLKENFVVNGKTYTIADLSNKYFGQCWTTKASSDAMWRIYSPDKKVFVSKPPLVACGIVFLLKRKMGDMLLVKSNIFLNPELKKT